MPELPEVQTIVNHLNHNVLNLKIINIEINLFKIIKNVSVDQFKNILIKQHIVEIKRIGKYLIFFLSNDYVLSVHLRMEGKFFFQNKEEWYKLSHTHIIFEFNNGMQLRYNDTRQFGTFHIYHKDDYLNSKELKKVAIDPLDSSFDWKYLKKQFQKSTKLIKTALLDQTKVAGIGNIYADEILFVSNINPTKKACDLSDNDFKKIATNSTIILNESIKNKGTTIHTYKFDGQSSGGFQNLLKVHTKNKQPCEVCGTIIQKTKVNGRGTYFCFKCQK